MRKMSLIALLALIASPAFAAVKGDYVEVRTASVYAGACHYNGELVTTGRDAIMAWSIVEGEHNGVGLAGARAVAVVSSQANLIEDQARKSEIVVDAASDAQADALVAMLKEQAGATFGTVVTVKRGPVTFKRDDKGAYTVDASNCASMSVQAMPDEACCKQPSDVCYEPLTKLTGRKVGFTADARYAGGAAGERWHRAGENSAFYGTFER